MADSATERRVAMSFMAHPDDAEFWCAGTLARLARLGWEIHIATLAPGDCGTVTEDRWQISARRTQEARQSAALLQATYHCLDERDGFIVYDKPTLHKAVDLFRRVGPKLVFTHALRDYMMDHEMTTLVARAAAFLFAAPNASAFPVPPQAAVPHLYYCDPPEGLDPVGNLIEPTTLVDIGEVMELKTKMLSCHASQREWLLAHHGMDEYVESMKRHSQMRGAEAGVTAAEAFVQHRGHAFPRNDILAELFPLPKSA